MNSGNLIMYCWMRSIAARLNSHPDSPLREYPRTFNFLASNLRFNPRLTLVSLTLTEKAEVILARASVFKFKLLATANDGVYGDSLSACRAISRPNSICRAVVVAIRHLALLPWWPTTLTGRPYA